MPDLPNDAAEPDSLFMLANDLDYDAADLRNYVIAVRTLADGMERNGENDVVVRAIGSMLDDFSSRLTGRAERAFAIQRAAKVEGADNA